MAKTQVGDSLPEVRFAIFGLGRIGTIHLNNLRNNSRARILYCVEESEEATNFVKKKWRLEETGTSFIKPSQKDKVFQDERVDAVLVCTPTFAHEELVMKSLESGKAVFCEKPLALNYEGIKQCINAAEKYQRPLMCAFNRRFDSGLRSLKERVDSGEIGKLQMVKTCSRDHPKPPVEYLKISGGIFHDCAVHDIDYICWILGEFPVSVSSFAQNNFEDIKAIGDFDTVSIMMKFPSGALAVVDLCRHAVYGYDQRVEVFGSNGMLTNGDERPNELKAHTAKGTTSVPIFGAFSARYRESYQNEMEHFINVVQGIEECGVAGSSILAVSKIASALEESARQGKTVTLDWNTNVPNGF
ncbi:unnamed protein product [Larinioides sclopetarius]|uniref:Inositol 2-dehydrogenase n=1 Tax=Larinioides sclopetarius TaxID=280406 RepID=A0AAV2B3T3_9ARAC